MSNFTPQIITEDGNTYVTTRKSGNIEISGGLPEDFEAPKGFEPTDTDAWMELMDSKDPVKRRSAMEILKQLGFEPTKYIHWEKDERALVLVAHAKISAGEEVEEEAEESPKKATKKGKRGKASSSSSSGSSSSSSSSGGSVDLTPIVAKLEELESQVGELAAYLKETHYLVRVLVTSDGKLADNAQDMVDDLHGDLMFEGNEEG